MYSSIQQAYSTALAVLRIGFRFPATLMEISRDIVTLLCHGGKRREYGLKIIAQPGEFAEEE